MNILYDLNIDETIIQNHPEIKQLNNIEIQNKINILNYLECNNKQIKNIIECNPSYLTRSNNDILKLIKRLNQLNFNLNILIDANPFILNLDVYQIDNYINKRINNSDNIDYIIDDLETNPNLFNEM